MSLSVWIRLLSLSPIFLFLFLMVVLQWGGSKAGFASWLYTVALIFAVFGANTPLVLYAHLKALLLAVDVLFIIWMALLFFHVSNLAGAVQVIGDALAKLTANRNIQALLLGWLFASFLQGLGGFGVPVAVTAPLLVGLGFSPIQAVIITSIGHGWAVTFGSMSSSFQTLMAVTNLSGYELAPLTAILLGAAAIFCGFLITVIISDFKSVLASLPFVLIIGSILAIVQYILAINGLWTVAVTGAALVALLVVFVLIQLRFFKKTARSNSTGLDKNVRKTDTTETKPSLSLAIGIYLILVGLTFMVNLISPLKEFLNQVKIAVPFPEIRTSLGWTTPAELGRVIRVFSHPGTILLVSTIIAIALYYAKGYLRKEQLKPIAQKVVKSGTKTTLAIFFTVSIAVLMSHVGMTNILAQGMSKVVNTTLYPLIAPFIGALGAFISGSNNNSNVLFAQLQMRTAQLMGIDVFLILAAQTAGGALGSIIAPAKVIIGCSTVGLAGKEGTVLGKIILYGIILVACTAVLTLGLSLL